MCNKQQNTNINVVHQINYDSILIIVEKKTYTWLIYIENQIAFY